MRYFTLTTLFSLLIFSFSNLTAQELVLKSDLEGLTMTLGQTFEPSTYVENLEGEKLSCPYVYYYNKEGVFSRAESISYDRNNGEIKANAPYKYSPISESANILVFHIRKHVHRLRNSDGWRHVLGRLFRTRSVMGRLWDDHFRDLGYPPKFYRGQDAGFDSGSSS